MQVAIVDDTQMNVVFMQHLVKKLPDCQPVCFTDALEALDWCLANDPDLLVVDYMMPRLTGVELVRRLRAGKPDTPILMVTANSDTALRHEALQCGVTDFLNKPVDNVEFLARARNMLALRASHKTLANHAAQLADEVRKATEAVVARERETIFCLSKAAEHRDPETGAHILRMAHYSRLIARCLGLPDDEQELLLAAAPMHDIGKVGTPDLILLKPGRLDPEEMAVMKRHAVIGYEVLRGSSSPLLQAAAEIAHTHHEKFDGSGYPRGLAGEQIPLFGRIVAVADVFDALTSARPYKAAWSLERALQLLVEGRGNHFDPACVDAFMAAWDEVLEIRQRFQDDVVDVRNRWAE
jgi:putative two-component system response regulator